MSKLPDYDFKKESLNQREFNDDVRRLWNNSLYEMRIISTAEPNWIESESGVLVYSTYGANGVLFISDMTITSKWAYVTLTALT